MAEGEQNETILLVEDDPTFGRISRKSYEA